MTKTQKPKRGGSTAPPELLYAMVLATRASIENPSEHSLRASTDGLIELVRVAEHLSAPENQSSLSMRDLIAAATGYAGFEGNDPEYSAEFIVHEVQGVVLRHASARQFLNDYLAARFGWTIEFSSQPDVEIVQLMKSGLQPGSEIT